MAREKKPYDLPCWIALVNKGQWFMVWEQNWVPLFTWRPALILNWPMERLDAVHWHVAVVKRPELADNCDFAALRYKYMDYDSFWGDVLVLRPDLTDRCDWGRLEEATRTSILHRCPKLILSVPEEHVTGSMWSQALAIDGELAGHCQWEKLTEDDWRFLLENQPQLVSHYVPHENTDWDMVFTAAPWTMSRCPVEKLTGWTLCSLLIYHPEFAPRADFTTISPREWSELLIHRPEFAERCDFSGFSASEWVTLLCSKPAFASKCNWALLGGEDWVSLLGSQPKLATHCDWDKLTPDEWVRLFVLQPELGKYCKIWDQFSFQNWQGIVAYHGDYAWRCPERMRKGIDGRAWFWEAADAWHENEERQIAQRNEGRTQNGSDPLFLGQFECKVSRSGLLHLPSEWRKGLGGDGLFMMRDMADANAFCLVPGSVYEEELRVSHDGNYSVEQRSVLESAKRLHIDARGRIRFPAEEMNLISGCGRIVLVGQVRSIQMRFSGESSLHDGDDSLWNTMGSFVGQ